MDKFNLSSRRVTTDSVTVFWNYANLIMRFDWSVWFVVCVLSAGSFEEFS